jgi:serine/threonine protein kinase
VPPIPSCYSPGLKQIINKLLTKDPTKRPNSSAILFDPLMIRIMQKSMTTSNNLKK